MGGEGMLWEEEGCYGRKRDVMGGGGMLWEDVGMWVAVAPSRTLRLPGLSSYGHGPRVWLGAQC